MRIFNWFGGVTLHPSVFDEVPFILGDGRLSEWTAEIVAKRADDREGGNPRNTIISFLFRTPDWPEGGFEIEEVFGPDKLGEDRLKQYARQWIETFLKEEERREALANAGKWIGELELVREPSALELRRAEIGRDLRLLKQLREARNLGAKGLDTVIADQETKVWPLLQTAEAPLLLEQLG